MLPIGRLQRHEAIQPEKVDELVAEIRRSGEFHDPIWVARDSLVVLNGHHRLEALRRLGARRVPAWLFDYDSDQVVLRRWGRGPPVSKAEVVRRASAGSLFPPKTTRHRIRAKLPFRSVPLAELLAADPSVSAQPLRPPDVAARSSPRSR